MPIRPTRRDAYNLLQEGALALADIEAAGIRVDEVYLHDAIRRTDWKIKTLEEELRKDTIYNIWRREYGQKANLASREQLGHVLFDVMRIPSPGFTRSVLEGGKQRYRTDKAALTSLVDIPFVVDYEELECLRKLRGTYLEGLRRETVNGFVHPVINLHLVKTFRSSADSVNIQNQYNRNPKMSAILRKCYIPREADWVLVEVDYSAVEVRGIGVYTQDPVLIKYLEDPTKDMHRDQACKLFFLKPDQVERKTTRDWSKNLFVFPEFYGSVYFQCAPPLWNNISNPKHKLFGTDKPLIEHLRENGITELGDCEPKAPLKPGTFVAHVKSVEDEFWNKRFTVYRDWKYRFYDEYRKRGYFDHLTGFREWGLYSRNDVTNHPNQGMCFHWLLWSIIVINKRFRKLKMRAVIVSEIHDCVLIDAPEEELQDVLNICREVMTEEIRKHWDFICVPLAIEADVTPRQDEGGTWLHKKPWVEKGGLWIPKAA